MKKIAFMFVALMVMSCASEVKKINEEYGEEQIDTQKAYQILQDEIDQLNAGFEGTIETRGFPFNRWISVCGDVTGFLFITSISGNVWAGLGVGAALSAVLFPIDTSGMPGMPSDVCMGRKSGSVGEMHNQIITNAINKDPQLLTKAPEEIYDAIIDEAKTFIPEDVDICNPDYKNEAMKLYEELNRESVASSFHYMKSKLPNKGQVLDVMEKGCAVMMSLDQAEIVRLYTESFSDLVEDSLVPESDKQIILDAMSLTEGSNLLWNFEEE